MVAIVNCSSNRLGVVALQFGISWSSMLGLKTILTLFLKKAKFAVFQGSENQKVIILVITIMLG